VLEKNGEAVILGLPRAAVASVDGHPLPPPVAAGTPAPGFSVVDTHGAPQSLEAYRGHATLLQFWATWCPHCRSDLPLMKELAARHQDQGLRILTVSIDRDAAALTAFLRDHPLPYPVISMAAAPELPDRYETQGVPAYFLIDPTGVIVQTWSGSVTERESDFEQVLAHLLGTS
jgi:peroxiredoxin